MIDPFRHPLTFWNVTLYIFLCIFLFLPFLQKYVVTIPMFYILSYLTLYCKPNYECLKGQEFNLIYHMVFSLGEINYL